MERSVALDAEKPVRLVGESWSCPGVLFLSPSSMLLGDRTVCLHLRFPCSTGRVVGIHRHPRTSPPPMPGVVGILLAPAYDAVAAWRDRIAAPVVKIALNREVHHTTPPRFDRGIPCLDRGGAGKLTTAVSPKGFLGVFSSANVLRPIECDALAKLPHPCKSIISNHDHPELPNLLSRRLHRHRRHHRRHS